jgi:hypothetical protein
MDTAGTVIRFIEQSFVVLAYAVVIMLSQGGSHQARCLAGFGSSHVRPSPDAHTRQMVA